MLRTPLPPITTECPPPAPCPPGFTDAVGSTRRLIQSSSDTATAGLQYTHPHLVDSSGESTFALEWDTGSLTLELRDPTGRWIDPNVAASDPAITYEERLGREEPPTISYSVESPEPGTWELIVTGGSDLPADGTSFQTRSTSKADVVLTGTTGSESVGIGETIVLTADLSEARLPVLGATVEAEIVDRLGGAQTVPLADDGIAPDALADDGQYTGSHGPVQTSGVQIVEYRVTAGTRQDGEPFRRTDHAGFEVRSSGATLDGFYRDWLEDTGGNAAAENLVVEVDLTVEEEARFSVTGRLTDQTGSLIQNTTTDADLLVTGPHTILLRFDGATIRDHGADGPYLLDLVRITRTDHDNALSDSQSAAHTTDSYLLSEFASHDEDADGVADATDNCRLADNSGQEDADGDGVGDACDNCPNDANASQADADEDNFGDLCDLCPNDPDAFQNDADADGNGDSCDPDADNDGSLNSDDCAPLDPGLWSGAREVTGVAVGGERSETISWDGQTTTDGSAVGYDVSRGTLEALRSSGGFASAICLASQTTLTSMADGDQPPVGDGLYYLVRARTGCGAGTWGEQTPGQPREVAACP